MGTISRPHTADRESLGVCVIYNLAAAANNHANKDQLFVWQKTGVNYINIITTNHNIVSFQLKNRTKNLNFEFETSQAPTT